MEIIAELENDERGPYAGATGFFGFNGDLEVAITIRTMVIKDGQAHVQAGGGVVADSDPTAEYEETLHKARAALTAVAAVHRNESASVSLRLWPCASGLQ